MKLLSQILNILDTIGPAIAVVLLWKSKKMLSKEMQLVFIFCLIQLICNGTATAIERMAVPSRFFFLQNNYWVYKLNAVASFLVILTLFLKYLLHFRPLIIHAALLLYAVVSILLITRGDGISQFSSVSSAFESMVVVALSLYFFYSKLINTHEEISIPETSIFWCVVGIFTYYAGAFFIFISYKYVIDGSSSTLGALWRFHNILLFLCSLYISYGILCKNYRTILS